MYLTLCIDAENRDEGVENHSEGTQQKTRPHSTEVRQNYSVTRPLFSQFSKKFLGSKVRSFEM